MKKTVLLALLAIILLFCGCIDMNVFNPLKPTVPPAQNSVQQYKDETQSQKIHDSISALFSQLGEMQSNKEILGTIAEKKAQLAIETDQNKIFELKKSIFQDETMAEENNETSEIIDWLKTEAESAKKDFNDATTVELVDQSNVRGMGSALTAATALFGFAIVLTDTMQKFSVLPNQDFNSDEKALLIFQPEFDKANGLLEYDFNHFYAFCDANMRSDQDLNAMGISSETAKAQFEKLKEPIKRKCISNLDEYFSKLKTKFTSAPEKTRKKLAAALYLAAFENKNQPGPEDPEPPDHVPPADTNAPDCQAKPEGSQRDDCLKSFAKINNRPEICKLVSSISKNDCLYDVAINAKNSVVCNDISEENQRSSCYYTIGIANQDADACIKIAQPTTDAIQKRDSCIESAAIAKSDANICKNMSASYIQDHYVRDNCYWTIFSSSKDPAICPKFISKQKQDECLAEFVLDPTITTIEGCKTIQNDFNKNACFYNFAVSQKNYLVCNEITDSNSKRVCLNKMTEFFDSGSNENLCNAMHFSQDKDLCEKKLAEITSNPDYCAKITNTSSYGTGTGSLSMEPTQDKCYSILGIQNSDVSLCEKVLITDAIPRDACFESIALEKNDANLCIKIKNQEKMFDCVQTMSITLNSLGICNMFSPRYQSSYSQYALDLLCYKNYSIAKQDPFICNMIVDVNVNNACMTQDAEFR